MDTAVVEDVKARARGYDMAGRNRVRSRKVLAKEAVIGDFNPQETVVGLYCNRGVKWSIS